MITCVGVKMGLPVTCVMAGKNNLTIPCSTRPISVRKKTVERVHVPIITPKKRKESSTQA